jgi:hypothetical protein
MKAALVLLLPLTMACTAVPAEEAGEPAAPGAGSGGRCNSSALGDLIGREASEALGAEALRRSGSRRLRWIRPGDIVTMDYSEQRLNIHLDAGNRVERFACG